MLMTFLLGGGGLAAGVGVGSGDRILRQTDVSSVGPSIKRVVPGSTGRVRTVKGSLNTVIFCERFIFEVFSLEGGKVHRPK